MKIYTVDFTKVKGKGDFRCPKCGVNISPDDESEEIYRTLEPVVREDRLEKVILQCNRCRSRIHLTGFNILD